MHYRTISAALACVAGSLCIAPRLHAKATAATMVFIDKSASVSFTADGVLLPKFSEALKLAVNRLQYSNDRLLGYYLHSGAGAASQLLFTSLPALKAANTPLQQAAADRAFQATRRTVLTNSYRTLLAGLRQATAPSGATSPILKSLEIASTQLEPGQARTLIYFSDMVECSGIRKNLAPRNRADAEAQARKDLATATKEYRIDPAALRGAQALVYLPQDAMAVGGNANIPYYWSEVFRLLGIRVSFH